MKHHPKRLALALTAAFLLAVPATPAFAGQLTLHPSGFGPMTYSSWKAMSGEPDSTGGASQSLYFQKMVPTPTNAAAIAIVKGVEGLPSDQLTGLSWDHREDGHCGAGAPRWNVGYTDMMGMQHTAFFGCNAAQHTELAPASGHGWCNDKQMSPAMMIPSGSTIDSIAIVFDEGNDSPNPPVAGCAQENPGATSGFVYLDNITVEINGQPHVWTSASDNGN